MDTVIWVFGLVGTVFWAHGLYSLYTSISEFSGTMRQVMLFFSIAGGFYATYSTVAILLGLFEIPISSLYWDGIPLIYTGAMLFWTFAIIKIVLFARGVSR